MTKSYGVITVRENEDGSLEITCDGCGRSGKIVQAVGEMMKASAIDIGMVKVSERFSDNEAETVALRTQSSAGPRKGKHYER